MGGGTIGGDPAAGALLLDQMREQVVFDALGARLEGLIGGEIQQALGLFGGEPIGDRCRGAVRIVGVDGVDTARRG